VRCQWHHGNSLISLNVLQSVPRGFFMCNTTFTACTQTLARKMPAQHLGIRCESSHIRDPRHAGGGHSREDQRSLSGFFRKGFQGHSTHPIGAIERLITTVPSNAILASMPERLPTFDFASPVQRHLNEERQQPGPSPFVGASRHYFFTTTMVNLAGTPISANIFKAL
jgi:hypothetical protein